MIDSKRMLALALTPILMVSAWPASSANKLESLDEDFLAYLAEFEGDEDDWTIVEPSAAQAPAKPAAIKPPAKKTTPPPKPATPDGGSKR